MCWCLVFGVGVLICLDIFWCTVARAARRAREYVDRYYLVDKYHTTKGEDAAIGGHLLASCKAQSLQLLKTKRVGLRGQ